jgi:hypothetical protein
MAESPKFEDPAELWAALVKAAEEGDEEAREFLKGFEKLAREYLERRPSH